MKSDVTPNFTHVSQILLYALRLLGLSQEVAHKTLEILPSANERFEMCEWLRINNGWISSPEAILWNAREIHKKIGKEIPLNEFGVPF